MLLVLLVLLCCCVEAGVGVVAVAKSYCQGNRVGGAVMSHQSVVVETNMFVNVDQSNEGGLVGVYLIVGVCIPFVLNYGEEICHCFPVLHVGQLL